MHISPTEAVKIYDVSKPTLYKDMDAGKVSFEFDAREKRRLNVAELERVYEKRKAPKQDLTLKTVKNGISFTELNGNTVKGSDIDEVVKDTLLQSKETEIKLLKERIDELKEHTEDLKNYIEETRNEHRGMMRLLEDKREDKNNGAILHHQQQRMEELMNAMDNLMQERHEQNQKMVNLEERLVSMKEDGTKIFKNLKGKNEKLEKKNKELEEQLNKSFWQKLVG